MLCPKCGSSIPAGKTACDRCGSPLPPVPPAKGERESVRTSSVPSRDKARDFALVGKLVAGKYRVLDVLGQGAFGTVYLVEITAGMVGEKLAMKVLPPELSSKPALRTQFINEIRVAMKLVDRYIVQIRDVGTTEDGLLYYTMDYCPGTTLAEILRREGKLPVTRAVLIALNVLRALQTAHAAGIIHRDLKPANIMIEEEAGKETVRVLDFGIAKAVTEEGRRGQIAGTPAYMPPEQFVGEEVGFASDLYSVGAVLYECLTGQKPYGSGSAKEVLQRLKTGSLVPPEQLNPEVAAFPGLSELVLKCLERNPEKRFQSAKALFDALNDVLVRAASPVAPAAAPPGRAPVPRPAKAPAPPPKPAAPPPPAVRAAAERIRRQRQPLSARRPQSSLKAIVVGLLILSAVAAAVIFREDIERLLKPGATSAPTEPKAPEKLGQAGKPPSPPGPEPKGAPEKPESKPAAKPTLIEDARKIAQAESARRLLERARKAFDSKDFAGAIVAARRALEFDPENAEALALLGRALLAQGDAAQAEEMLEKTRARLGEKTDRAALSALAEAKMRLPEPKLGEAEAIAKSLLAADPSDLAAVGLLAQILEKAGRADEAEALIRDAKSRGLLSKELDALYERYVTRRISATWKEARSLLEDAKKLRAKGEVERALEQTRRSAGVLWSAEADLLALECLLELGKLDEAQKFGEEARRRAKTDLETAVLPSGEIDRSLPPASVRNRLDGVFDLVQAERMLAGVRELTRPSAEALETAKAAEPLLQRAKAAIGDSAGKEDPLAARLDLALAKGAAIRRDSASALKLLESLRARRDPKELWTVSEIALAVAASAEKEEDRKNAWKLAASALSQVAEDTKVDGARRTQARYLTAKCQLELGELQKAEGLVRSAIEGFDRAEREGLATPELYEDWSRAYAFVGNLIRSARCLRRAYEIAPTPERCLRAVDAYRAANPESPEARELLKEGKARFPDHPELRSRS